MLRRMFEQCSYKATREVKDKIVSLTNRMRQSALAEHAVKRVTKQELVADNQGIGLERAYATLIVTQCAHKEFHHLELPHTEQLASRVAGCKDKVPESSYHACPKKQCSELLDIRPVKDNKKPQFSSLSADHASYPTVDLMLLERLETTIGRFDDLSRYAVNAMLLKSSNILVQDHADENEWLVGTCFCDLDVNTCITQCVVSVEQLRQCVYVYVCMFMCV